jgi:hypothetical protein
MESIYSRLYRYRQRPLRSPLEDYLTEALADLLGRCPLDVGKQFIEDVLLADETKLTWRNFSKSLDNIAWNTQLTLPDGRRPDLVIQSNGKYLIVVESKIASPIGGYQRPNSQTNSTPRRSATSHSHNDSSDDGAALRNQLECYGTWLAKEKHSTAWAGCLSLLTHFTKPPEDFLQPESSRYGSVWRHSASWATVFRWLRALDPSQQFPSMIKGSSGAESTWKNLAREFADFLKEQNVSAEQLTSSDLSAAALFVGSTGRIENTFERIRQKIKKTIDPLKQGNLKYWEFEEEARLIWEWFYLKNSYARGQDWTITWGIRFPDHSSVKDASPALPIVDQVFVNLGADKGIPPEILKQICPQGWSVSASSGLIIARPVVDFLKVPDQFGDLSGQWINDRIAELKKSCQINSKKGHLKVRKPAL